MTTVVVPPLDEKPWPTLGPGICDLIEERAIFGPGSLKGQPARVDAETRALVYKAYELYPRGHELAGRRRFRRVRISLRKGTAKTEKLGWVAFAELHPEAPVRFDGWKRVGSAWVPVGRPVRDPYIPLLAYTVDQVEELAYNVLLTICTDGPDADLFDAGLERILRLDDRGRADGKAVPLAQSPSARDGARTTFQGYDEPLALDTPVPTTRGWSHIGSVIQGDEVFGRDGRPVKVLGVSPVQVGRTCYRLTFRDGTSVVSDANHRWKAVDWSNRPRGEQVVTTEQMLQRGLRTSYGLRWRLPRASGVDGAHRSLPIDPYLLGLWLGDGSTNAGYLHSDLSDYQELSEGISHTVANDGKDLIRWLPNGLRSRLRWAGLLGDKHIPVEYQLASREQRLALLRGLMDTDGHTTRGGSCTFTQGRRALADQVLELVRSLGAQASLCRSVDARSRTGEMWRVLFSPAFRPFRLARKVARFDWRERVSTWWPAIQSIEPVDSVPVRCIAVDSDDHLFVVGRGFQLTHNTHRLTLPRHRAAYETMEANLPKRPLDDPWSMGITTAGEPGSGSVAELDKDEADLILKGKVDEPELFYFHREAGPGHDMTTLAGRIEAVREASGPAAEWSDLRGIAKQWDRVGADKAYLERVWTNRWTQGEKQAFDAKRWRTLARPDYRIPRGAAVTAGFDGSRWKDTTALVVTEVETGFQHRFGLWIPEECPDEEVPVTEVDQAVAELFDRWRVVRFYGDPARGWDARLADWSGRHGPKVVAEFYTDSRNLRRTALMCRSYAQAIHAGEVNNDNDDVFWQHIGAAQKRDTNMRDDEGKALWVMAKERPDSPKKIDLAMAGGLSWQARLDALSAGNWEPEPEADTSILVFR